MFVLDKLFLPSLTFQFRHLDAKDNDGLDSTVRLQRIRLWDEGQQLPRRLLATFAADVGRVDAAVVVGGVAEPHGQVVDEEVDLKIKC